MLLATTAAAAPKPKDEYSRGVQLYQAGAYEEAIEAFREAYRQKPQALILFNIAQAFRKDGKPASALEHYQRFLLEAKSGEEPASQANAKKYVVEIEAQLALTRPPPSVQEAAPSPAPQVVVARPPPPPVVEAPAPPPEKTPVYKKWWLWTAVAGVAVVVVAVGVGVGVGTKSNDPSTALGTRMPVY